MKKRKSANIKQGDVTNIPNDVNSDQDKQDKSRELVSLEISVISPNSTRLGVKETHYNAYNDFILQTIALDADKPFDTFNALYAHHGIFKMTGNRWRVNPDFPNDILEAIRQYLAYRGDTVVQTILEGVQAGSKAMIEQYIRLLKNESPVTQVINIESMNVQQLNQLADRYERALE
jgi:hypothetical protein